jgi:CheY-like chemotaxis protein
LLLHTIEGFSFKEVGQIIGVEEGEASELVQIARREMADSVTGSVMIIEDEAIIAMDIESIVAEMGHRVTGVARTRDEAVKLGKADVPDLILADIQLADNSSGIDAVNDLLRDLGNRPVIFITAFPERLLTGDKPEPAFLISKPYTVDQVVSAVSQAMFFSSTETLHS